MKKEKEKKEKKPLLNTFGKVIVFFCLLYGLALTTLSYIWSYLGLEPLVDLSTVIITTIVNPVLVYLIENALCDIFQHNKLAFSTPLTRLEQEDKLEMDLSTYWSTSEPINDTINE